MVVDHTEVDAEGFVIGGIGGDSNSVWAEIGSLELRATSRDREALTLDPERDASRIYFLRLGSRELRKLAKRLRDQRAYPIANSAIALSRKPSDDSNSIQQPG